VTVHIDTADGVVEVRLDRPERKNALDVASITEIVRALESAATDDSLRAIVLRGAGDDFCAGADWVATNATSPSTDRPKPRTGSIQRRTPVQAHRLIQLLVEVQLPVVCAVRGWAAGLGCQLALAADFTIGAESSRFWEPFLRRGFSPDSGATWLLPRLVGIARAKALLLLGRPVAGADAAAWGMSPRAVPEADLDGAVGALLAELGSSATIAIGLTKRCIHAGLGTDIVHAMQEEALSLELSSRTSDFREGLAAFKEHREPNFEGR
jgi:2-(1,2-epoxy-1,2-dihydrophenyl)acetyl-CoA isomerase